MGKNKAENVATVDTDATAKNKLTILGRGKPVFIMYIVMMSVTLLTLAGTILGFIFIDSHTLEVTMQHIGLCAMALLLLNVPLFLEKKFKVFIPSNIVVLMSIMVFSNYIIGEAYSLYYNSAILDKVLHTISGVVIGLASLSVVTLLNNGPLNTKLSPFFVVLFAFCLAMTGEYIWELFEYGVDCIFGTNMQRWQNSIIDFVPGTLPGEAGEYVHNMANGNGLVDTMNDMIVNIFGALGVCVYAYLGLKFKPNWFIGKVIMPIDSYHEILTESAVDVNLDENGVPTSDTSESTSVKEDTIVDNDTKKTE